MLEWAIALDMRNDNPCDRVLPVLGPQNDIVTHRLALPHTDVAAAIETVRTSKSGQPAVKLAFEFLVLTAARSAEVRLATWDEMDVAGRVWTVPAPRMKAKREHRVPLCSRALEILDMARALGDGSPIVFRMRSGRAISASTLPKMLQYHRIAAVAHSFRSSFRDWAAEKTDHPREVIEAALAHVVQNKVEAPTRGRTCSSVDGNSWTIGPSIWRAQAGEPGTAVRARAASPPRSRHGSVKRGSRRRGLGERGRG
ncbi:MAG: tyrosine-type recombinase/integrase [Acidobacteria bacterium]|nr:tyrosine-type recombinase/integrase [Acidobacteriota bacterium]